MKKVLFILLAAAFLAGCSKETENLPDFSGFEDLEFPKRERKEPEEPDNSELEEESPAEPTDETTPEESPDIPEEETPLEESAPEAPAEEAEDYDPEETEEDITEPEMEEPEENEEPLPVQEESPAAPEDETPPEEGPVAREEETTPEEEPDLEESTPEAPAEEPVPEENTPAAPEDETIPEESPDIPEDETAPEESPIIQEEEPDILPGFLLFSDGTAGPGPMEEKTPAGVVFEAENGTRYAVGLSKSATRKAWATKTSGGQELSSFSMKISEITTESGDRDGSDNLETLLKYCPEADSKVFPVFDWAENYDSKNTLGIFSEGWYIPTVYETEILLENRIYIEETLNSMGLSLFSSEKPLYIWTSNTSEKFPEKAWRCDLVSGTFSLYGKGSSSVNFGLVIRKL